ncbi:hypothetical protein V8C37DRAFT_364491 [Trichoderma ceciliae]
MLDAEQKSWTLVGHVNLRDRLLPESWACTAGRARTRAGRRMKRAVIFFVDEVSSGQCLSVCLVLFCFVSYGMGSITFMVGVRYVLYYLLRVSSR